MRVVSFNIHHGTVGRRGPVDPARLGAVCAAFDADVIALQEVDRGTWRARGADLAAEAAAACGMAHVFGPSRWFPGGWYGNALLVRGEIRSSEVVRLPKVPGWQVWQEQRTFLEAEVTVAGRHLLVAGTHLAVPERINGIQLDFLLERLRSKPGLQVAMGDLNRKGPTVAPHVRGARLHLVDHGPTFPARKPRLMIDHVLVSPEIAVTSAEVVVTEMSDHAALVVDLDLERRR